VINVETITSAVNRTAQGLRVAAARVAAELKTTVTSLVLHLDESAPHATLARTFWTGPVYACRIGKALGSLKRSWAIVSTSPARRAFRPTRGRPCFSGMNDA
jgi:hypothetical protein